MRTDRIGLPVSAILALLVVGAGASGAESREVSGRVVDGEGRPVAGAVVADFWRANGPNHGPDGKPYDLKVTAQVREFWGHLGEMAPATRRMATADADGRFQIALPTSVHTLLAMDPGRRRGGLATLAEGREGEPVTIRLGPTVGLRGSFRGPDGAEPGWTHVYIHLPDDPRRPLEATRLVSCGSFESRFAMALPPGRYVVEGYNDALDAFLVPERVVDLAPGATTVDLGVLPLSNARSHISTKIAKAKSSGRWVGVADRYGKPSPEWHLTDARGIAPTARVEDFRGKWLLVYFWGFGCRPCLKTDLPALSRFYEEHATDRGRFEVVAVCIDDDGELASMADLDRKLGPIVAHVWGGKPLPFPVALDASTQSMESFGISILGPHLIAPDGTLVKGDEATLAERLRGGDDRPRPTGGPRP